MSQQANATARDVYAEVSGSNPSRLLAVLLQVLVGFTLPVHATLILSTTSSLRTIKLICWPSVIISIADAMLYSSRVEPFLAEDHRRYCGLVSGLDV